MISSYHVPPTLPAVVTNYFEPSDRNDFTLVGGNRATHQRFVSHQIRLINTMMGFVRGVPGKRPTEMAKQNPWVNSQDLEHLVRVTHRLCEVGLLSQTEQSQIEEGLQTVFAEIF